MAVGNGPDQSFAPRATAPKSHQAGAGGGLVDKHQSRGIKQALLANPAPPRPRHVRPFLLARAQAFFDGDIMSLEKSPDRGATAWNSLLAHRRNDLIQGQIRLLGYQSQQPFHLLLQRRRTPAAQLCSGASAVTPALQPPHRRTGAQAEAFGRFPPRCSGHDGFDNAFTQVIRIGLRHRLGPPEPRINAARLAHSRTIGNPRFNFAGKRSNCFGAPLVGARGFLGFRPLLFGMEREPAAPAGSTLFTFQYIAEYTGPFGGSRPRHHGTELRSADLAED